ncbi:MAG: hypothetical protein WD894_12260 [Pirellulales bacterium]
MLRHTSLRDDRRRRSLLEDATAAQEPGTAAKSRRTSKAAEAYTELARSECHARWSDFVPLRNWSLAAFFTVGLLLIAALEAAYYFATQSAIWSAGRLRALDLAEAGSLAGWWSALVMVACALLSAFVYSVRRFRLDDYRGRYRVWLWGAALWLVMSIDGVADLRGAVRTIGVGLSGRVGLGDGVLWWLAPWSVLVVWLGLRMMLDARACRTATSSFLLGFGGVAVGFIIPQLSLSIAEHQAVMVATACSSLGRWWLLFGLVAFARHVLLDAHGQLPVRALKPKREKKKSEPPAEAPVTTTAKSTGSAAKRRDDLTTRVDPAHTAPFRPATSGIDLQRSAASGSSSTKPQTAHANVAARTTAAAKPTATSSNSPAQFIGGDDDDDGQSGPSHKLSRAERKRLRKQQRTERYDDE